MGVIDASNEAASSYIDTDGQPAWNTDKEAVMWLVFHVEMLILGPQKDKTETISQCVGRRINLFCCGFIELLWEELHAVHSRAPQSTPPPSPEMADKSVQDAADKDNYRTAYARAVKPAVISNQLGQ